VPDHDWLALKARDRLGLEQLFCRAADMHDRGVHRDVRARVVKCADSRDRNVPAEQIPLRSQLLVRAQPLACEEISISKLHDSYFDLGNNGSAQQRQFHSWPG
jgi:hypothetical protein